MSILQGAGRRSRCSLVGVAASLPVRPRAGAAGGGARQVGARRGRAGHHHLHKLVKILAQSLHSLMARSGLAPSHICTTFALFCPHYLLI